MRRGDVINGYLVLADPTNTNGGQCRWTFVSKDDSEYFIKQFLWPKYPTPASPGSSATKAKKLAECETFERHHRSIMDTLTTAVTKSGEGGNLIVAKDWFLSGTTYFKVTEKIDVTSLSPADISTLPLPERLLLLVTVSHSLQILHLRDIVHADLKPDNILVKQTSAGTLTTKLIDFDNAFFSGRPPSPDELIGTTSHYSPEIYAYLKGEGSAAEITTASDIFALGLIFCQYLSGRLPDLPTETALACVAAYEGTTIEAPSEVETVPALKQLIGRMLLAAPDARPSIREVFEELRRIRHGGRTFRRETDVPDGLISTVTPSVVVRGYRKFLRRPATSDGLASAASDKDSTLMPSEIDASRSVEIRGLNKFRNRG